MPQRSAQSQDSSVLPSQNIFMNLFGGEDLHVNDWVVFDHIISHGKTIRGLAEFLLYVRFILEKSAGRINRPQWHCSKSICEVLDVSPRHLRKLEENWVQNGWIIKVDRLGTTNERTLGNQFDAIRLKSFNLGSFDPEGEDDLIRRGRIKSSGGGGPNGPPNPNNPNPNDLKLHEVKPRKLNNKGSLNNKILAMSPKHAWCSKHIPKWVAFFGGTYFSYEALYSLFERFGNEARVLAAERAMESWGYGLHNPIKDKHGWQGTDQELCDKYYELVSQAI